MASEITCSELADWLIECSPRISRDEFQSLIRRFPRMSSFVEYCEECEEIKPLFAVNAATIAALNTKSPRMIAMHTTTVEPRSTVEPLISLRQLMSEFVRTEGLMSGELNVAAMTGEIEPAEIASIRSRLRRMETLIAQMRTAADSL